MSGIRFRWKGSDVVIETITNNYLYTVQNARDAYHEGQSIIVVSSTMHRIRFTKDGIRIFE